MSVEALCPWCRSVSYYADRVIHHDEDCPVHTIVAQRERIRVLEGRISRMAAEISPFRTRLDRYQHEYGMLRQLLRMIRTEVAVKGVDTKALIDLIDRALAESRERLHGKGSASLQK